MIERFFRCKPERDGEQPSHRRIEAVKGPKPGYRQPGPSIIHSLLI